MVSFEWLMAIWMHILLVAKEKTLVAKQQYLVVMETNNCLSDAYSNIIDQYTQLDIVIASPSVIKKSMLGGPDLAWTCLFTVAPQ